MKSSIFLLVFSLAVFNSFSQTADLRRKIEVTGTAETEITPDIIYINISLKEYYNGNKKVTDIDELENQLKDAVARAGIPRENLTINNLAGFSQSWRKKKNDNFATSKQYRLKLSDPAKFNQVISALDTRSIENTYVESYDHSKIIELKKDLRIKALQAAKQKAAYLAEVVNDQVGDALSITEVIADYQGIIPQYANAMTMARQPGQEEAGADDIGFKTIKLSSQVRVIFQLN